MSAHAIRRPPDCDRNNLDCLETLGKWLATKGGYTGTAAKAFLPSYEVCSAFEPKEFVDPGIPHRRQHESRGLGGGLCERDVPSRTITLLGLPWESTSSHGPAKVGARRMVWCSKLAPSS